MNRIITSTIALSLFALEGFAGDFQPHTDPGNVGEWTLIENVSDEFGGANLDKGKWRIQGEDGHYENRFKGRAPSQFAPGNVSVRDGMLRILSKWDPSFEFAKERNNGLRYENITTGAIISREKFLHGYLETRCKAATGPISSSFWTTGVGGELDVFEHWGANSKGVDATRRYHSSFHDWRKGSPTIGKRIWTNVHSLDFGVGEDFHVYGFEWAKDYFKIYVDGGLVRTVTREEIGDRWVVDSPQKVWFDSEVFPWAVKPASLKASDYPGDGLEFVVDYVRVWQREGSGSSKETRTNLIKNPGFESDFDQWTAKGRPKAKRSPGNAVDTHQHEGGKSAFLHAYCSLEQHVPVKPNTKYILSGWLSLPGTDHKRTYHHGAFGVKDFGGDELRLKSTDPAFTRYSLQFTTGASTRNATVFFTNDQKSSPAYGDHFELFEVGAER